MVFSYKKHKSMGIKDIKYDIPVYQMLNTQIRKYKNTKCLKDPTCAIFLKSMGFKDIKYDIPVCQIHYIYITFHRLGTFTVNLPETFGKKNGKICHKKVIYKSLGPPDLTHPLLSPLVPNKTFLGFP